MSDTPPTTSETPTPRSDEAELLDTEVIEPATRLGNHRVVFHKTGTVKIDFARQLERELNEASSKFETSQAMGLELARQVTEYLGCSPSESIQQKIDEMRQRLTTALARVKGLEVAYGAACAFIDSHAADPDLTDEMCRTYAQFKLTREAMGK